MAEQLICNQQVVGSTPITSSIYLGEFPSGQRGQTVNLLSLTSLVRIQLPPPNKKPTHEVGFLFGEGSSTFGQLLACKRAGSHLHPRRWELAHKSRRCTIFTYGEYPASTHEVGFLFGRGSSTFGQLLACKRAGSHLHPRRWELAHKL